MQPVDDFFRRHRDPQFQRAWRQRQLFKLLYILGVIFVLPAVLIGSFALYLAIYEPGQFRKAIGTPPASNPEDDIFANSMYKRELALRRLIKGPANRTRRDVANKLKGVLYGDDANLKALAIEALGEWGQPEDAGEIVRVIRGIDPSGVPKYMFVALAKLKGPAALEELTRHLGNDNVRQHAIEGLSGCGQEGESAVIARLEFEAGGDPKIREGACLALQTLGRPSSAAALELAALDEVNFVAKAAIEALSAVNQRPPW